MLKRLGLLGAAPVQTEVLSGLTVALALIPESICLLISCGAFAAHGLVRGLRSLFHCYPYLAGGLG